MAFDACAYFFHYFQIKISSADLGKNAMVGKDRCLFTKTQYCARTRPDSTNSVQVEVYCEHVHPRLA